MDSSEEEDGKQKTEERDENGEMENIVVTDRRKKRKAIREDGTVRKEKKVRQTEPVMDDSETENEREENSPMTKEETSENGEDILVKRDISIEKEDTDEDEEKKHVKNDELTEEEEKREGSPDEEEEDKEKPVKRDERTEEEEKGEGSSDEEEDDEKKHVKNNEATEEEEKGESSPDEEEEDEKKHVMNDERAEEEEKGESSSDEEEDDEENQPVNENPHKEEETKPENENTLVEENQESKKETLITSRPEKKPPQGIPHRESLNIEEEAQEQSVTEEPIFELLEVNMRIIGNRIALTPSFKAASSMKMFCTVILNKEKMPSTEGLMYRVTLLGQDLKDTNGHDTLYLVTADLQAVKGVGCIGYVSPNIYFGPLELPVIVEPPPAPDINTRIIEQTPLSLEVYVKSSMESRVWCKVLKEATSDVTTDLIRTGSQRMVRRRASLYFKDLIPNTEYQIWCYAESKEGIPMKQSLEEVKLTTRTLECI